MKLVLFPGLACTDRLFILQKEALTDLEIVVPDWIAPEPRETLEEFAVRWAQFTQQNYLSAGESFYIGGLSFGGMVAPLIGETLHARGFDVRGCLLLATVQCGREIPEIPRLLWKLICLLPYGGWRLFRYAARRELRRRGKKISFAAKEVFEQLIASPCERSRHVLRLISAWRSKRRDFPFPVWHLHGSYDCLLPRYCVRPDETIPCAGHCLSLTHPDQVNEFINRKIRERERQIYDNPETLSNR